MEHTVEAINPSSEHTIRQEPADDFQFVLGTYAFLLGCLNPVVLLVVLLTIFFGQKKLRGPWLINFGLLAGLATVVFFNAVYSYLSPVLEIVNLMHGNALKLMQENGAADSAVDLVLNHAGTWFCAQLPLGVPVGLIIAGIIICTRSVGRDENNA
ncbi:MAG: hypothetical protein HXO61_09215 [Rothia mucilaginosa]|uniref:Uncharacterized protein n=1 Tax=Rothia mucilaginosa TaxID=43675 RepID=A0A930L382_9MICC|nr:hypothetical protein [Rothia mucilaginosa]MBF1658089.1 hypothetical protein [Rothia mucilaginosa]